MTEKLVLRTSPSVEGYRTPVEVAIVELHWSVMKRLSALVDLAAEMDERDLSCETMTFVDRHAMPYGTEVFDRMERAINPPGLWYGQLISQGYNTIPVSAGVSLRSFTEIQVY